MADVPLPPLTGGPGTPPLPPPPPTPPTPATPPPAAAVPTPEPELTDLVSSDEDDAVAALSPFAVLKKKQSGSLDATPAPSESVSLPVPPSTPFVAEPDAAPAPPLPEPTLTPPSNTPPPLPATPPPLPSAQEAMPDSTPVPAPTVAPAANTGSGSPLDADLPDETPDTETLVKQAAEAHANPLILPRVPSAPPAPKPTLPGQFIANDPASLKESLDKVEVKSRGPEGEIIKDMDDKADPIDPLLKEEPVPMAARDMPPNLVQLAGAPPPPLPPRAPLPTTPPAPPLPPRAPIPGTIPLAPSAPLPQVPLTSSPKRTSPILAILGILLALLIGAGGLFVLALSGTRIPVLSTMITGLPGGAVQAANMAITYVEDQGPYRLTGVSTIDAASESESQTGENPDVYTVTAKLKDGQVLEKGNRFLADFTVSANEGSEVSVLLRDTSSVYMASFPANLDPRPASLALDDLQDTLLSPVMRPIPLEALLRAVTGELGYRKVSINNVPASSYMVNLDVNQLKTYFPKGSVIENPVAEIAFAWKGDGATVAQPLQAVVNADFTYLETKYTYGAEWLYSGWKDTTPPSSLALLAETDAGFLDTELTAESFVGRLGIIFARLPHGTTASVGDEVDTTTRFTPVIPSGDVIEVPQTARAVNPIPPTGVATTEAKQRDAQRKQDLLDIQKALEQYKLEKGSYPDTPFETQLASDQSLFTQLVPKYLTKMPVDPLNSTYYYAYNVSTDIIGTVTGYTLRAVLEDRSDVSGTTGATYFYYQLRNK